MARSAIYGLHAARNLARTTINGKRVYLGEYGSPESKAAFNRILADWESAHAERSVAPVTLTVSRLAVLFLKHAEKEYVRDGMPTGETANFRHALKQLTSMFHGVRVIDFGPKKLKQIQATMVANGYAQQTINFTIRRIRQVFDWGVSEEIVPGRIAQDLRTVAGLSAGRTKAAAPKPKGPAPIAGIAAIKPFVTRPVWGMIEFMLLSGCRPSEAIALKWTEIDNSGDVWFYRPGHHKTAHRGKNRHIAIGPKCQQVLNGLREMSRSDFVFDPQVGFDEYSRKAFGDKAKNRKVGACYTKHGLNSSVRVACDKAGVARWSPGQLRKTRATQARQQGDLETAQQILGHSSKQTTERHYAMEFKELYFEPYVICHRIFVDAISTVREYLSLNERPNPETPVKDKPHIKDQVTPVKTANELETPRAEDVRNKGMKAEELDARCSDDFRSVWWFGTHYSFTTNQSKVVEVLWKAWKNKTPEVSDTTLLDASGGDAKRIRDVF